MYGNGRRSSSAFYATPRSTQDDLSLMRSMIQTAVKQQSSSHSPKRIGEPLVIIGAIGTIAGTATALLELFNKLREAFATLQKKWHKDSPQTKQLLLNALRLDPNKTTEQDLQTLYNNIKQYSHGGMTEHTFLQLLSDKGQGKTSDIAAINKFYETHQREIAFEIPLTLDKKPTSPSDSHSTQQSGNNDDDQTPPGCHVGCGIQ